MAAPSSKVVPVSPGGYPFEIVFKTPQGNRQSWVRFYRSSAQALPDAIRVVQQEYGRGAKVTSVRELTAEEWEQEQKGERRRNPEGRFAVRARDVGPRRRGSTRRDYTVARHQTRDEAEEEAQRLTDESYRGQYGGLTQYYVAELEGGHWRPLHVLWDRENPEGSSQSGLGLRISSRPEEGPWEHAAGGKVARRKRKGAAYHKPFNVELFDYGIGFTPPGLNPEPRRYAVVAEGEHMRAAMESALAEVARAGFDVKEAERQLKKHFGVRSWPKSPAVTDEGDAYYVGLRWD